MTPVELIAIGASWGGLSAVGRVLAALSPGFDAAVVIVQHRQGGTDGNTGGSPAAGVVELDRIGPLLVDLVATRAVAPS